MLLPRDLLSSQKAVEINEIQSQRAGRAGDIYHMQFDMEVDDKSEVEGGRGQRKEEGDSRGKHVEDTVLCG